MRFLIVSPEIEDTNYRGVQFVTKHVIKALSTLGHEVVLLTSHPRVKINVKSVRLKERVLNTYFRQYMVNGALLNAKMAPHSTNVKSIFKKNFLEKFIDKYLNKYVDSSDVLGDEPVSQPGMIYAVWTFTTSLLRKLATIKVDKTQLSGIALAKYIDSTINMPSFYRLSNAMPKVLRWIALEKVAKQVRADVVFISFPLIIPKLRSAKVIQVIYDLIPFEIADEPVEFEWLPRLAKRIDYVTRNSDQIFTISEDSKNKILEIEPDANIKLVGAAMSAFKEELAEYTQDSSILAKLNLRNTPYLVFISSVEKRKNVHRLIQAFVSIANETSASLVIVGNKTGAFREIYKELSGVPRHIKDRVIFTGYASEFDKYTLLKHARALVNPTLYEGFGLPVLEAFALGCPVVASVAGALAEISGNATLKIQNPYSVSEISSALREILRNSPLRSLLIKKGFVQSKLYTEEKMYQNIKNAIAELES